MDTGVLLPTCLLLLCVPLVWTATPDEICNACTSDQFCFRGTVTLCLACSEACEGCMGPGPDECVKCHDGFSLVNGVCTQCPAGKFGAACNSTCNCLDDDACNHITGSCTGKCQKGFYKPPLCQDECPDLLYGLDCLEQCHCYNDTVCSKKLGMCPGNLCHPDWTSFGCSKRLPKLSSGPLVMRSSCTFMTVAWPAWNSQQDFGDLPVAQYRLYSRVNGSDPVIWKREVTLRSETSKGLYSHNVTGLTSDAEYLFRVDVHYSDDNKIMEKASPGIVSLPARVPCTTTTVPPPITIPVIAGTGIFNTMTASNLPSGSLSLQFSLDSKLQGFNWNLTLRSQLTGVGNCASIANGNRTETTVAQSDTSYLFSGLSEWSQYTFTLEAQGLGVISTTQGTETFVAITAEVAPSGNVSGLQTVGTDPLFAILTWQPPPCELRGGVLRSYLVRVESLNTSSLAQDVSTNGTTATVRGLTPFSMYSAQVQYLNSVGAGPFSEPYIFETAQGVPAKVEIDRMVVAATTLEVYFLPPSPANGVISEYQILYSDSPAFTSADALVFTDFFPNNGSFINVPVLRRLKSSTDYYVKVRAQTGGGYGEYGGVRTSRTLQTSPLAPTSLLLSNANTTCVDLSWNAPDQTIITVDAYTVTVIKSTGSPGLGTTQRLLANETHFSQCGLEPASQYDVSIRSWNGGSSGSPVTLQVSTVQSVPPPPPVPQLVNVSSTLATVQLEPATLTPGPEYSYQVELEVVPPGGSGRRKRLAEVPGIVYAQLSVQNISGGLNFVVGDGKEYGGFENKPLDPGQTYQLYYVVLSSFNGGNTWSFSRMDSFSTLAPATDAPVIGGGGGGGDGGDNGVLIGVILALIFVILIIIAVVIFIIWWRRRQNSLLKSEPYLELRDDKKLKAGPPRVPYDPEKYWNQVTSLRESRYIVVGRECLPDDQLLPVSNETVIQPGAALVSFKQEFRSLPHRFQQATTMAADQYPERNRFPHILAYDHSRVELAPDSSSTCPYVNANYLTGYRRQRCYVAAQSPYDDRTAKDFWRLICQHSVKTVVMIANVVEDNIVKCTQFWPQEGKVTIGQFFLELQEEVVYADFTVRDVNVRSNDEQFGRTVRLFEYTSWPDHGVPDDPIPFLDMRYKVRQYHADDVGPILVHCGTGVARTGVFVAVDALIEQYANEGRVSVFSFVRKMRKERPLMVRTYKQYVFIYECLLEEFHAGDTMTDALSIKDKYHRWTSKNTKTGHTFLRDQFQMLQRLTRGPEPEDCATAMLPDNVKRNRFQDVLPSDQHRPELTMPATLSNTNYINAVFMDGYRRKNQFLVTQTPLHTTLIDFWRLVHDQRVSTVVMMDNYKGLDDTCAEYWPSDVPMKQWEPFFVETTAAFQQENVTIRNLKVTNTVTPHAAPHMVRQFQFNAWAPNSLTPVSKTMALDLLDLVLDYQESSPNPQSPIVVHCEDGATHSGLFVALALLCERMSEEQEVDVFHVIKHIRRRRPQILHDYDQFRFCYKALWDFINLRMPGGTFTDSLGQTKSDKLYGVASLSLDSYQTGQDSLY